MADVETVFIGADKWQHPDKWYWWFLSGDNAVAPTINNGEPYLPSITTPWVRNLFWWCRNPLGNFFGRVIGVAGVDRYVYGPAPVLATTPADETPPRRGWKWAITKYSWLRLPFVGYYGWCEFYFGWRPYDGAFGFKLVNASRGEN
jgi:hypothetical protein